MKEIPRQVRRAAMKLGNSISFNGTLDGKEVYSVGTVDKNGSAVPTGLPVYLLWDGESVSKVTGYNALDLLARLVTSAGENWVD